MDVDISNLVNAHSVTYENFDEYACNNGNNIKASLINILCLNIRSIRPNWDYLRILLQPILELTHVICLIEINIKEDQNKLFNLDGFTSIFHNRTERRGGGIALYIKETITAKRLCYQTICFENLFVELEIEGKIIKLLSVYRPPNASVADFLTEYDVCLKNIAKVNDLIVLGDFNLNLLDSNNNYVHKYKDMMAAYGLLLYITEFTREDVVTKSKTLIDHIHCRSTFNVKYSSIICADISDHYVTAIGIGEKKEYSDTRTSYTTLDNNKILHELNNLDWNNITATANNDPGLLYDLIVQTFNNIYEKAFKIKTFRRNTKPWFDNDIRIECLERDRLYKRWKNSNNNNEHRNQYKRYRNYLNKKIVTAKRKHYNNELLKSANIRDTWKIVNNLMGKRNISVDDQLKKSFGTKYTTNEIVGKFVDSFIEKVNVITHDCAIKLYTLKYTTMENSFYLMETTPDEIKNIVVTLNDRKSPGIDNIRVRDLKAVVDDISPIISKLINLSFNSGIVPDNLKIASVRPVLKSGNTTMWNNYRPISVLCTIDKVMEKCMEHRLSNYLEKYQIIHENQYGFQKGKSVNTLLSNFSNKINNALNTNKQALVLFLDFSKAFDTINFDKLLIKLERIGIRGKCLEWFDSYLKNRRIRVKMGNTCSKERTLNSGVPQGSILGPLLYKIFVNDIVYTAKNSTLYMYADDTMLVVVHKNVNVALEMLQTDFDNLMRWTHDNGLVINQQKSKVIHVRMPHIARQTLRLKFNEVECLHQHPGSKVIECSCDKYIECVQHYKYLGVIVDEHYKWDVYIEELCTRLRKVLYLFYYLKKYVDNKTLRISYHACVESILQYGIMAWGGTSRCYLKYVQDLQNKFFKLLSVKVNENSQLLTVENLYKVTLISNYFFDTKYKVDIRHDQNTRMKSDGKFIIPRYINTYGTQTLTYVIPKLFNELPVNVKNVIAHPKKIRKRVKQFFLQTQIDLQ